MPEYNNKFEELNISAQNHAAQHIYSTLKTKQLENFTIEQLKEILSRVLYYWLPKTEPLSRYFAEEQELRLVLRDALSVEDNVLGLDAQKIADQFKISKHKRDLKEFNNKLLELAKQALKEFYYYLLRRNQAAKIAFAEAEGFKMIDESELCLILGDKEYKLKFIPCQYLDSKQQHVKETMQRVLTRLDRLLAETDAKIGNIWQEIESSYVSKKLLKQLAPVLDMLTKSFENIKNAVQGGINYIIPTKAFQLEKNIEDIEKEAIELDNIIMSKLTDEDISNISMLTADIKDPQQILKIMEGVKDSSNIAEAIKLNVQNLQYKDFSKYKNNTDDEYSTSETIRQEFDSFLNKLESDLQFGPGASRKRTGLKKTKTPQKTGTSSEIGLLRQLKIGVKKVLPGVNPQKKASPPSKMNFTV